MKTTNLINLQDSRQLSRMVWMALTAVIIVIVAFSGYYYWDRYVHLGDQSPLDIGVEYLEEQVREDPQNPESRIALAQYYLENGVYEKAIDQSQQLLAAYPDNDNALFVLGMAYVQDGQVETALEPLEQFAAVRREGEMARSDTILETALYFLGQSYVQLDRPAEAIAILSEALEINKTDADAMYQLGLAYAMNGEHETAVSHYQNAIRFVPDFLEAYSGMAESYGAMGMSAHVAYARGMEAFSLQEYKTAQTHLESATADLPDFAPAFLGLGLAQEQLGEFQNAQTSLERVLELDADSFMANHALGRLQLTISENQ